MYECCPVASFNSISFFTSIPPPERNSAGGPSVSPCIMGSTSCIEASETPFLSFRTIYNSTNALPKPGREKIAGSINAFHAHRLNALEHADQSRDTRL